MAVDLEEEPGAALGMEEDAVEDDLELLLGKAGRATEAGGDSVDPPGEEQAEDEADVESVAEAKAPAEAEDDEFSAWVAETADVAVAAGEPLDDDLAGGAPQEGKEEEAAEDDDNASMLLAMAPKQTEAERVVARSLLLGRGGPAAADAAASPALEAAEVAAAEAVDEDAAGEEPATEDVEMPAAGDAEAAASEAAGEAAAAAEVEEVAGGEEAEEVSAEAKAAAEEELLLLEEQDDSAEEPEAQEAAEPEAQAEKGAEPEAQEAQATKAAAAPSRKAAGPDVTLLAASFAEVWDVDELDAQAEAFGATEAVRDEAAPGAAAPRERVTITRAGPMQVMQIDSDDEDEVKAPPPLGKKLIKLQPKSKSLPKRAAPDDPAGQPAKAARHDSPANGHSHDLDHVVVNFLDVGQSYARKVLQKEAEDGELFDWEGVRTCVQHLASERNLQVLGVMPKDFQGEDSWSNTRCGLPEDIRTFCELVEESSSPSCSAGTVTLAHRENCRFVDGEDNTACEGAGLCSEECRAWMEKSQALLRIRYAYDPDIGTFNAAEGSFSQGGTSELPSATDA